MVPGEREPRAVARTIHAGLTGVELNGCEPRVLTQFCGRDLVHRNRIMKTLAGGTEGVGPGEPKRATAMRVVRELMRAALHDRKVAFVTCQRREPLRERVAGTGITRLWKPRLLGHSVADPEAHHPLGRGRRGRSPGEPPESERLERRQGQQRAGRFQEPAAGGCGEHGCGLRETATSFETRGFGRPSG